MTLKVISKIWFSILALSVAWVIPVQAVLNFQEETGMFAENYARVFNMFWFFTILSNILVGYVSYRIVLSGVEQGARFNVAKHTALVAITVTGIVYHLLLAADANLSGLNVVTDFFLHTFIPLGYVLGWIIFNNRGQVNAKVAGKSLLFPIIWAVAVMIRGPIVDYYPYNFMDVRDLGYAEALITMGFVTLFFVALAFGYFLLDKLLEKRSVL